MWYAISSLLFSKKDLLIEEIIELAVQVNGKLRTTLKVDRNLAKKDIEELVRNDTKMINHLKNKKVKKIIHVEGRLVNFVLWVKKNLPSVH